RRSARCGGISHGERQHSGKRGRSWRIAELVTCWCERSRAPIRQFTRFGITAMPTKSEKVGVVVSNKMQKSIVVAVEWQVRHGLYGKTERRTSTFMAHDEENAAKPGDL